jgi:hypothetical protein
MSAQPLARKAGSQIEMKTNEKLMNVEHRTSNIEHRIMYAARRELLCRTVNFKKTEQSDSTLDVRRWMFDVRRSIC